MTVLLLTLTAAALAPAASGQTPSPSPSPSGQTPSPSPSPSGPAAPSPGDGLAVQLLNPSPAYDATPKISDRFDGVDSLYTIVVRTTGEAESAILEASIASQNSDGTFDNEITIGELARVNPASDIWELDWDIPPSLSEGAARLTVRAFVEKIDGFVETGSDSADVDVFYSDPTAAPLGAYETIDLLWPEQEGPLGWYKPRVGAWRVVIDGTTSPGANFVQLFVSTTPPGEDLVFVPCGSASTSQRTGFNFFSGRCTLAATALPSQVRAVAALAEFREQNSGVRFTQAADVRSVGSYDLDPHDMSVAITPSWRRAPAPATACQSYGVRVTDEHDRPVLGANVDIHATGPTDELIVMANGLFVPGDHATEQTLPCPAAGAVIPGNPRTQGDHNVPGGTDTKHMENGQGTGLDTQTQAAGETSFLVASEHPGFTDFLVWVDDERIDDDTDQRRADNDRRDAGEPSAEARAQWLGGPLTLSLDPVGGTAPAGTCFPYVVKARAGTRAVPGINVDLHATGPDDELDFCDPPGSVARRAPSTGTDATAHEAEDPAESHHFSGEGADTQHTEGETDAAGNFVVGLTSPVAGDTTVVAWIDGETDADNDLQAGNEASASGTISWATAASEAELSFLNPSPYGGDTGPNGTSGAGSGTQLPDAGGVTRIRVRADMAAAAPALEILVGRANSTFSLLGEAERVARTDVYELGWPIDLPDGNYVLRARMPGTDIVEDVNVKVGAGELLPTVPAPAYETLRLDRPETAAGVPFSRRETVVSGSASPGTEGVEIFYTKVPAKDTPRANEWIFCGYADLSGTGTARQEFSAVCRLTGSDQAEQVTGIAAITFDCTVDGCDANPRPAPPADGTPPIREQGQKETGQALRVFGYEAHPLLAVEPPETEAVTGDCRRFQVVLRDQTGQPLGGENVDLHLAAASPSAHFCRPADAAPSLRAPDAAGHTTAADPELQLEASHEDASATALHTEGETLPDGSLVFGVTSGAAGDALVTAWLDRADDDVQDPGDPADTALVHWVAPRGCSIVGSEGPDVLTGTAADDVFCGFEGNDVFKGRGGDDVVYGGAGSDRIFGGRGRDTLRGGRGRDLLDGGRGRDVCRGGPGRDRIRRCESASREGRAVAPRRSGV